MGERGETLSKCNQAGLNSRWLPFEMCYWVNVRSLIDKSHSQPFDTFGHFNRTYVQPKRAFDLNFDIVRRNERDTDLRIILIR